MHFTRGAVAPTISPQGFRQVLLQAGSPAYDEGADDLYQTCVAQGVNPAVALAFFNGLSHEEIATQTHLPLGTVKSQIRRALITLRETLGDTGANALLA